jgi:O-methyltransferase
MIETFAQSMPHTFEVDAVKRALLRAALTEYDRVHGKPVDPMRVVQFYHLVTAANRLADGEYIELGTHRGFTLRLIHQFMDPARRLFSLDTFEGFDARDLAIERTKYVRGARWQVGNFLPTSAEGVAAYVGDGAAPANLTVIKGWFPDSFAGLEAHRWRFIHVDFDLYEPIRAALERLWPALVPGGVVLVHDYGCAMFPAARVAVDEFCARTGLLPVELGDRWGSAALRKPL